MRLLKKDEVKEILSQGRILTNDEITSILDETEREQPEIYHVIYGEFSDAIGEINKDMSNLFLDLCFDVIWIFRKAFGKPPILTNGEDWVINKIVLLDTELKSLDKDVPMNEKLREKLQRRFAERSFETVIQMELLNYLNNEVIKYASFKKERGTATHVTANLLFVIVRLMGDLYSLKT